MLLRYAVSCVFMGICLFASSQNEELLIQSENKIENMQAIHDKIVVEIWSDVMCPFCYIGKRKFEIALEQFQYKEWVEIQWKSFQLSPDMVTQLNKSIDQFLAEHKGISLEEAKEMNAYVTKLAKKVGLTYNFDKSVVANSFNAHRFSHVAKVYGKQNEAEENLFNAYFTEGKNIDDYPTLIELGNQLGLDSIVLQNALESGLYAEEVRLDIKEAERLGVRGVPFFVFDRKYAISGAQESVVFLQTLQKVFTDKYEIVKPKHQD